MCEFMLLFSAVIYLVRAVHESDFWPVISGTPNTRRQVAGDVQWQTFVSERTHMSSPLGLLVASRSYFSDNGCISITFQATEGQDVSCIPRIVFRYNSCVPGCWQTEQLYCRIGSRVPWLYVRLWRCKVGQIKWAGQNSNSLTSTLCLSITQHTWSDNKVRELIAVKVLHTSLLTTTVVAFKVLPLGSYAPMPAPIPPFKTILKLVLWNGLQSSRCITPDVINVIKMLSFQYFPYLQEQKKVTGG